MIVPVMAADYEGLSFDVSEYQKEVSFFVSTGVIAEDDAFITSDQWVVTRGEFIRLAIMSLNLEKYAGTLGLTTSFTDLNESPYAPYVALAEKGSLVDGISGLLFMPDEPLTAEFAAQVGVAMTGRRNLGGQNSNPMSVAGNIKLFKNVTFYEGDKLDRGNTLKFLKNVLLTDVVEMVSFTDGGTINMEIQKGTTVLNSCFGLDEREGVITSDSVTTIFGSPAKAGYVGIDGKVYPAQCTNYIGMAGQRVTYYVETIEEGYEAVKCVEADENSIITVGAQDIQSYNSQTVSYNVILDGKSTRLPVSRQAYIAYNFKADYAPERMIPSAGFVTFIDHDGDGTCDVVLIHDFVNVVADFYSNYSETIYDKEDATKNIDLSSFKSYTIVDLANNPMEPTEIQRYNIVSVYKNTVENTAHLIVSNNKKSGVLQSVTPATGVCVIGSSEYRLSQSVRFVDTLTPGNQYDLYFDALGEIAYVTSSGGTMAYLVQGMTQGTLAKEVYLRVLPESTKKLTEYQLADKVMVQTPVNGEQTMTAIEAYDTYLTNAADEFIPGMSLIGLNKDGEINKVILPYEISSYAQVDTAPKYPLYYLSYIVNEWPDLLKSNISMVYKTGINGFNRWVILGNDAKVFYAPPVSGSVDPEAYVVKAPSYGLNEYIPVAGKTYYSKDLSDLSVRYILESTVAQNDFGAVRPGAVTEISRVYDEKLGITNRISVMTIGGEQTFLTTGPDVILGQNLHGDNIRDTKVILEVGDVIRWAKNEAGNVSAVELLWDSQKGINDTYNDNGDTSARFGMQIMPIETKWDPSGDSMTAGIITKKSGNVVEYVIDKTDSVTSVAQRRQRIEWGVHNTGSVFDYSGRKVSIAHGVNANELVVGDRIVLISYSGQVYNVLVYRR